MRFSKLAAGINTSPIISLAAEINKRIQNGEKVYNLTIGDFNPQIFPIPKEFKEEIIAAYHAGHTNYPGAAGIPQIRNSISKFLKIKAGLDYSPPEILISCGSRPLIYCCYRAIVNPGDKVIFPVPSWNNEYYTGLNFADPIVIETTPENNFMPTAESLKPHLKKASLVALCSPLNPTGTVLNKSGLEEICDVILEENKSRPTNQKPLYLLFDQIYWLLTFGKTEHYNAVILNPEMRDYCIFIDGMSKAFAATGVRLGWGYGPPDIINKMKTILAHMGAWAAKAEQMAAGNFLAQTEAVEQYLNHFRNEIKARLVGFYKGFINLKERGFKVNAIEPQAAIYLTVQLEYKGFKAPNGAVLESNDAVHRYILNEAKIGLVPFSYFGASEESSWYRLSIGTCRCEEIEVIMSNLSNALSKLKPSA